MKKRISGLILILAPILLLYSCNKDKFSEKDALDAQQKVDLLITVLDESTSTTPVEGATVTLINDTSTVHRTTNSFGIVVFPKIKIGGQAVVSVTKTNFTSVLKTVTVDPSSYRQAQVSAVVSVYSLESSKIATLKGRLTMQNNLIDRNREPAVGLVVKARNSELQYTGQIFTATTDNDGKYTLSVPVSSNGNYITLIYPDFTVNQTLAIGQAIVDRPVLYKPNYNPVGDLYNIISVPSVYATVPAPVSSGSGFMLGSKANRTLLSSNSSYSIIDGGSGYNGGASISNYQFSFSPDPNGVSAKLQVDITAGKITNIDFFNDNGATYSTPPTLLLNALAPTTPANIAINFKTTYKIYISNKGSNYIVLPQVSVETETFNSGTRVKAIDPNINDGSINSLGYSYVLDSYTTLYGGLIKSAITNADTIITATTAFSTAPVFTVTNAATRTAVLTISSSNINADSTLNSITITSGGSGYNPSAPPVVTLTTLGGFGQGAVAKATVSSAGAISGISIINPGMKYVKNINDYNNSGNVSNNRDYPSYPITGFNEVKPGDIIVNDVYYGTGYQLLNQSFGK